MITYDWTTALSAEQSRERLGLAGVPRGATLLVHADDHRIAHTCRLLGFSHYRTNTEYAVA